MCGLFGSIGLPSDPARIDIVAHRGPDGRGWRVFDSPAGPVALGHRRLAIIDVSDAGLQPMADPSGQCNLVFNGEIYNYIELREELKRRGEVFTSETDSEVLLRAYMVWGHECLPKLRGMFAFIIWDARKGCFFAARDRFGIKPLYMTHNSETFALASEIKQLLGLASVPGRINVPRVHDFLANGITDHTGETLFEGVTQLRAGEYAVIGTSTGRPVMRVCRWYPVGATDLDLSAEQAASRFHDLLADAVRLHLRSDVPVGSCLSGGLDSSSIVCLMAGLMPKSEKVNTVSACYADKSVDEKAFIEAVVSHAGTQPHYVYPRAEEVLQKASDITWHQDEPFGSTSIFAQWCVFEEAQRAGIKVMLDGQGADEQLAGYHFCFPYHLALLARKGRLLSAAQTMLERRSLHGASLRDQAMRLFAVMLPKSLASPLRHRHQALTQNDWLGSELLRAGGNREGPMSLATSLLDLPKPKDLKDLCIAMTFASNLQMLLHWEDRNSMAHSIEARVPFLDHPLVEFSLGLGNAHKIVGSDTKVVLRRAMQTVLPEVVRKRRDKIGFQTPEQSWFSGTMRGAIHDAIETTLARYPDLLNPQGVRGLRDSMLKGQRPIDSTLWRIVNLGLWGDRFRVSL